MARSPKSSATFHTTEVRAIMLARFECIQFPPEESESKALSFDVAISKAAEGNDKGVYFSQVMCKAQRVGDSEKSEAYYVAMYNVLFGSNGTNEDEVTERSKQAVASAGWFHFVSLFAIANGQMKTQMPDLPYAPRQIDVRSIEQLNSAFNVVDDDHVAADEP